MRSLIVLLLFVGQMSLGQPQDHKLPRVPGFVVYDGTTYAQKPDLGNSGIKPITVIYMGSMWKNTDNRLSVPDPRVIRLQAIAAATSTGIAVIDNESWPIVGPSAADSIQKY